MSSIEKAIKRLAKSRLEKGKTKLATSSQPGVLQDSEEKAFNPSTTKTEPLPSSAKHDSSVADKSSGSPNVTPPKTIQLDYESLSKVGYIVPNAGNKQLSEEYRIIKRPIIMNALGKGAVPIEHGNLISISSSLPSEGKTFTALNLALSIATEMDSTVLLIDGDVLRFSLSKLLGIENEKGLIDVLENRQCTVGDVLIHTQIPSLKVVSAGNRSENSTELLASKEMEGLLDEIAKRYPDRIIIFDSPPILATSEAAVLNQYMGQILLVVEAGQTPVDAIKDSLAKLDSEKAIGLILNKCRGVTGSDYYGSYY